MRWLCGDRGQDELLEWRDDGGLSHLPGRRVRSYGLYHRGRLLTARLELDGTGVSWSQSHSRCAGCLPHLTHSLSRNVRSRRVPARLAHRTLVSSTCKSVKAVVTRISYWLRRSQFNAGNASMVAEFAMWRTSVGNPAHNSYIQFVKQ